VLPTEVGGDCEAVRLQWLRGVAAHSEARTPIPVGTQESGPQFRSELLTGVARYRSRASTWARNSSERRRPNLARRVKNQRAAVLSIGAKEIRRNRVHPSVAALLDHLREPVVWVFLLPWWLRAWISTLRAWRAYGSTAREERTRRGRDRFDPWRRGFARGPTDPSGVRVADRAHGALNTIRRS
jgi:hypothetical protein